MGLSKQDLMAARNMILEAGQVGNLLMVESTRQIWRGKGNIEHAGINLTMVVEHGTWLYTKQRRHMRLTVSLSL